MRNDRYVTFETIGHILRRTSIIASLTLVASATLAAVLLAGVSHAVVAGDNGKIAFVRVSSLGGHEIWTVNTDGTEAKRLTSEAAVDSEQPSWSPDGTKIAFLGQEASARIWVMNADGTGQQPLTSGPQDFTPAWSPDGTQIAFSRELAQIFVVNVADGSERRLTGGFGGGEPAWSPDGTRMAFSRATSSGGTQIFVLNVADDSEEQLTSGPEDYEADWSPDGTKIAFRRGLDAPEVFVVGVADPVTQTRLAVGAANPSWSPDGTKIAFESRRADNRGIFVMNADGTAQTQLTTNPASDREPSWQPLPQGAAGASRAGLWTLILTGAALMGTVALALRRRRDRRWVREHVRAAPHPGPPAQLSVQTAKNGSSPTVAIAPQYDTGTQSLEEVT